MTRWLVTGAAGMLGQDVMAALQNAGQDAVGLSRPDIDITVRSRVRAAIGDHRPDIVINCAALTAVDDADVEVAVFHRAGEVTLLKRCPHHVVLALRDSATEHQSLGAAAHPGPQRAHQHLARTRLRQLDRANLAPSGFADPERARFHRHPHPPLPARMNRSVAFTV